MPGNFYQPTVEDFTHWPTPNYTDPEERTWLGPYAIAWSLVSTLMVFGRLYLRFRKRSGPFGLDDLLIFLAWVFSIAFTITACLSAYSYKIGRHVWDIPPQNWPKALQTAWFAQVFFIFTTCCTKCSILLFYRRMVKNNYSPAWIYTVWILLFITVASSIAIFVAYCFMCMPLNSYWNFVSMEIAHIPWKCINGEDVTIAAGTLTIASDFWTAALPCAMFQKYNIGGGISKRQKIILNVIFCLGFLVTGVGIARTYYLWQIGHKHDISWVGYNLFATSVVEIQLAIICVCVPFLRAFLRNYFPDFQMQSHRLSSALNSPQRSKGGTVGDRSSYGGATLRGSFAPSEKPAIPLSPMSPTMRASEEVPLSPLSDFKPTKTNFSIEEVDEGIERERARFSMQEEEERRARERVRRYVQKRTTGSSGGGALV